MPEESRTPDLVELARQNTEAASCSDFDAVMSSDAPDAVWNAPHSAFGTYEGAAAIRSFFEQWIGAYEEYEQEIVENRDLGNGALFTVVRFGGCPADSTGRMQETWSWTGIWAEGACVRVMARTDIDEARAAAERFAEERG